MTDWKALCQLLASHMAYMQGQLEAHHELDELEDYYWYRESEALRKRVADALARWGSGQAILDNSTEPAPAEEVAELVLLLRSEAVHDDINDHMAWLTSADARRAADLLEQRQATPVPVSERLPGPEDCDGEGRCWIWDACTDSWTLHRANVFDIMFRQCRVTHWLPVTALPLPQVEVK